MRPLYEIENEILDCFDAETGEILDEEKLESLNMEKEKKLEGVALAIRMLEADVAACEEEKKRFQRRILQDKAHIEGYKSYLSKSLQNERFRTSEVDVRFRKSKAVDIVDEKLIPVEYIKYKTEQTIDKQGIRQALTAGEQIDGCRLVENVSVTIK